MEFGLGAYGLSFAAGGLSTLSPCVLPLLPILLATALTAHRFGSVALAAGLALSFTVVGVLIASLGGMLGLDPAVFRSIAAMLLIVFGALLLSVRLQEAFAVTTAGISGAGHGLLEKLTLNGWSGQFVLGLLLGIIWSPCVGPTLGAAITLASQGQNLAHVTLLMALFGLGAGLPLVALGLVSRSAMLRVRSRLLAAGKFGKQAMGALMLILGITILSGTDKLFEAWALQATPEWLISLTTSI